MAPFVGIGADGCPYLEGVRCAACGEILAVGIRRACPKCAAVGGLEPVRLAEQGKLYAYTVVHRSFPGVKTPFVVALVVLDGGGSISGNLIGAAVDEIKFDMPLRVKFESLEAPGGKEGRYMRHVFAPLAS